MKKKIIYGLLIISMIFGLSVRAQNSFNLDQAFLDVTGFETGDISQLHFNFSGNDFGGFLILGSGLEQTGDVQLGSTTISCQKQINGLYHNPARGNRLRPLDQNTLTILNGSSEFQGYDSLNIEGGFFTQCNQGDSNKVYGYIKHTYNGVEYEMWAGLNFNLNNGSPIYQISGSLEYISAQNNSANGYIYDKNGGTAKVYSENYLYATAVFTGDEVISIGGQYLTTGNQIKINIFSNKNSKYKITGDVVSTQTGNLSAGIAIDVGVSLLNLVGEKEIFVTVSTGAESITKILNIHLEDVITPTVNLESPYNGITINENDLILKRTGHDNMGIAHYDLYINGSAQYVMGPTNNTTQIISSIPNGTYNRYVVATDLGGNTGQSATWTFTIAGEAVGPTLISPVDNADVNIGELSLLWSAVPNASSGYTRQIATNNTCSSIVVSGATNSTGVSNILHYPGFMTGEFFWRVIDNKTAGVSECRAVNIVDLPSGTDTQIEPLSFGIITGANLSQVYSSNTGLITGLTNNVAVLARLENNIGALFVNNVMVGSQSLVKNNDQVRIELISSSFYNSGVSAKLIVGTGSSTVSGTFQVYTMTGSSLGSGNIRSGNLPYALRIQAILFIDTLSEMYKHNPEKWAAFLTTFKAIVQDRIALITSRIPIASNENEKALLETQKLSLEYLHFVIEEYLRNIDYNQYTIYTAPNCKQYLVEFDDDKMAYTSPNFLYAKYFPTWTLFTRHIDVNNPGNCYTGSAGDTIITPNNKTYIIALENGKRTSNNMKYKKYFDSREELINYIIVNNPSETWDHTIDTSFEPVVFVAPNGKNYSIFKTSSSGNNANKYSSFMFVSPKYFNSLDATKNHIRENNK